MGTDFFKPAAAGFESPLELLLACHERIRRFAGLLVRLGPHLALHGSDAQAQEAARSVLRYFDVAAPLHHQDEDDDLFPALQRRGTRHCAACWSCWRSNMMRYPSAGSSSGRV